ncbi:MAG: trypsin-like peptidase domain-containing protein [Candidatus Omnitrophica bacterium]|nr:trypsin-like peptidase domain-containing protein [Candidatus Omnitrophota bacterium]
MSLLVLIAVAGSLGSGVVPSQGGEDNAALDLARQLNQAFIQVVEKVSPSVVVITVTQDPSRLGILDEGNPMLDLLPRQFRDQLREHQRVNPQPIISQGSGVVIREDGYILTNSHVVEAAEKIRVRFKDGHGEEYDATVRGVDPQSDIAVIKIDAKGLRAARLADSDKTRVGEFTIAIGAPFDLDYSVTFGHVSAKGRSHVIPTYAGGATMDQDFIQTDASINPGNSGGPLANIDGEVIGINTLIRGLHTGIGFAVPSNLVKEVADQLIRQGKFTRARLGISITTLREDKDFRDLVKAVSDGVVVRAILSDGPAAKSDLQPADVITAVDGQKVATAQELKNQVRSKKIGQPVTLDVVRGSKAMQIAVMPEEWTDEAAPITQANRDAGQEEPKDWGLKAQTLSRELAGQFGVERSSGVIVTEVEDGCLASKQGVKPGDVITEVNQKPVANLKEFRDAIKQADLKKGVILNLISGRSAKFVILKDSGD